MSACDTFDDIDTKRNISIYPALRDALTILALTKRCIFTQALFKADYFHLYLKLCTEFKVCLVKWGLQVLIGDKIHKYPKRNYYQPEEWHVE